MEIVYIVGDKVIANQIHTEDTLQISINRILLKLI